VAHLPVGIVRFPREVEPADGSASFRLVFDSISVLKIPIPSASYLDAQSRFGLI